MTEKAEWSDCPTEDGYYWVTSWIDDQGWGKPCMCWIRYVMKGSENDGWYYHSGAFNPEIERVIGPISIPLPPPSIHN